jgi:hypothetical protein
MPRKSSKRRAVEEDDDEMNAEEAEDQVDELPARGGRRRRIVEATQEATQGDEDGDAPAPTQQVLSMFSQQAPEASQSLAAPRAVEERKLEEMDANTREKGLTALSRLVLFKALERDPIDRLKCIKEAELDQYKITSAAYEEVESRLRNVFGFTLNRIQKNMEKRDKDGKAVKNKFTDRLFVSNMYDEASEAAHNKLLHSNHTDCAIEKGLLMLILALIFCKGDNRADGSRWLLGRDLYRLLNAVDEAIPDAPPDKENKTRRSKATSKDTLKNRSRNGDANTTPNVDAKLEQYVQWDYLLREKAEEGNCQNQVAIEEGDFIYSMGPRAGIEIGRKQIIHFCAEILDEEADPSMLKEVDELEILDGDNIVLDDSNVIHSQVEVE